MCVAAAAAVLPDAADDEARWEFPNAAKGEWKVRLGTKLAVPVDFETRAMVRAMMDDIFYFFGLAGQERVSLKREWCVVFLKEKSAVCMMRGKLILISKPISQVGILGWGGSVTSIPPPEIYVTCL